MLNGKSAKLAILATLVITLLMFAGCGKKDDTVVKEDKAIPVVTQQAKKENISAATSITGKVSPMSEVIILPKFFGKVGQVMADIGSQVKKGSVLAKIDTTDLEISMSAALNGMQNAKLTHNQAILNYNNAKTNYDRMQKLFTDGAISQQQLEQAQLAANLARDAVNAPAVATAQNQIDSIRNQISNAIITSPVDGEIATRSIDPGEMASQGQPLFTVVNIDHVLIEATVAESDIASVKQGQKVSVKVDAAGGNYEGIVKILSPIANAQTKGYPIKVEVNNPGHNLKPGMFAEIQLVTKNKADVVVIPKEALINRGSDKLLYVVVNGTVEERVVETGIESNNKVEIVKGLIAGDKYVISGQQSLFDKAKVSVQSGQ